MKRQYVKLSATSMWHVGTKTIWTMCGRSMPHKVAPWRKEPWADVADEPDGPVCKVCLKALAAWEREFGGDDAGV